MPSRHARVRIAHDDPKTRIRSRYMEAIRAGATIADATAYANADPDSTPVFTKSVPIEETPPLKLATSDDASPRPVVGYGAPGERVMLLPGGWSEADKPPEPKAVDPETESVKRPMAPAASTSDAPTAAPSQPAAAPPPVAPSKPVRNDSKSVADLLQGDPASLDWPRLRMMCAKAGLPMPNSRLDAVNLIRAHLAASADKPPES